ncbi:radical SAM family heme chaperone HemW [Deinococcus peraridilitoris]|uniref:Heme chaperone HemW n=1 Tax=Deinococcus peraridilitoris (strain DSM 19664 / LMG 22246 / CIP 109416 / KR-200) TaxID=937777 RepID=L0A056_DEIPD|nr:radical SAM family heme chaperone HemW [Deinococcus peraridilitoris]AFZ67268.1 putative oxygen-independent coproporphyrinogen III oxidase [Deinococcus peraridilitoris DSM 19664]
MNTPRTNLAAQVTDPATSAVRHLYLHVPFCPSICPYCDFHVLTRRAGQVEAYLKRLREEAAEIARTYRVDLQTVYLGGGTPSFLREAEMAEVVDIVRSAFGWGAQENTLEVNPGTVSPERARQWRELGFDRASVGVQSLHDPTLKFLGRQHDARSAREAVEQLLAQEFRVSGDLITAVAGQPLDGDVRGLVELGVEHVSAYTLTIESGTPFARRGVTVREEDEREGFSRTAQLLGELGFERYEISNYARSGGHSRHNLAYWTNQFYLGLGPGAAGHYPAPPGREVAGQRVLSERRTNPHLNGWLAGQPGESDLITPEEYATDALFMGLRLTRGVDLRDLSRRSGLDVAARYAGVIEMQTRRGALEFDGRALRATEAGQWVLNDVIRAFLEA